MFNKKKHNLPIRVADNDTEKKSKASKVQPKNAIYS